VTVNLRSVHMDKQLWGDPENFRPERFIGPDGKFQKDDRLMLFGTGITFRFAISLIYL
jgi:methyl farnesoate epoxidase / farnesoate epoxidase